MKTIEKRNSSLVLGPDGTVLALANLPPTNTIRWVPRRKAEVVAAVSGGLISMSEACGRYSISLEEFAQWKRDYEQHGLEGLKSANQRKTVH
jgi:transposase-like protein